MSVQFHKEAAIFQYQKVLSAIKFRIDHQKHYFPSGRRSRLTSINIEGILLSIVDIYPPVVFFVDLTDFLMFHRRLLDWLDEIGVEIPTHISGCIFPALAEDIFQEKYNNGRNIEELFTYIFVLRREELFLR